MTNGLASTIAVLTLEIRDRDSLERFAGSVVGLRDFFECGGARREGTDALADENVAADSSH